MRKTTKSTSRILYFPEGITAAMSSVFDYPLTVIEAPMGYGKTTAVRENLSSAASRMLWQRIFDGSRNSFWASFCTALSELDEHCSQSLRMLGFPNESISIQEALRLIGDLELPERTVIVIDDYHLANDVEVNRFIELLVINEIPNLHMVLTARYTEFLRMDELAQKGYLNHITKDAFEFTARDIRSYYQLCGISLETGDAERLHAYTEGWVSALYLLMLNYQAEGSFMTTANIHKLVERAVYEPWPQELKDFLLAVCIFDSFTVEQAAHIWKGQAPAPLIDAVVEKNAFITYVDAEKSYFIHSILKHFLLEKLDAQEAGCKKRLYQNAAHWHMESKEYFSAMRDAYVAGDFDILLAAIEADKGFSINAEYKDLIITYFAECPPESKRNYPYAMLIFARRMYTFNERELFKKTCEEFLSYVQSMDPSKADFKDRLLGEYELLLSFTGYNDIGKMSQYHQRACALLKTPSSNFDDKKGSWTFGSPSILYMFYRKSGELEQTIETIKEAMPFYYQLTNGHGKGAELVMEAERFYHIGDFEAAEIAVQKAAQAAKESEQSGIILCAIFLQMRLAFIKGDFLTILREIEAARADIYTRKWYLFMHTLDMCEAHIFAGMGVKERVPAWITQGEFKNTRLFFPVMPYLNSVYGRVLLINGEYLKLIGTVENFIGAARIFPNVLAQIYTYIHLAAANRQISRHLEAQAAMRQALELAMPDRVYMPFVENCDFIHPLLEELQRQGDGPEDIGAILKLYRSYKRSAERMAQEHFSEQRPLLTAREMEIARLAAEGLSNKEIGTLLFIAPNTVKTQLKNVFTKLGINSRALVKDAIDRTIKHEQRHLKP